MPVINRQQLKSNKESFLKNNFLKLTLLESIADKKYKNINDLNILKSFFEF